MKRHHGNAGRKQSLEHIAKRVESVRKTKAEWTEERQRLYCERVSISSQGRPAWNKGKPQSDEQREKNSESHKGIHAGAKHWNYGNNMPKASIEKMRLSLRGKKQSAETIAKRFAWRLNYHHSDKTKAKIGMVNGGINNGQWKGGKSFEPYPTTWNFRLREAIRDRDGRKCRACGMIENGKRHHIHHVDYCKENILPDNLVSLCNSCHGKTNSNRSQWQEFFTQQNQTPLTGTNN